MNRLRALWRGGATALALIAMASAAQAQTASGTPPAVNTGHGYVQAAPTVIIGRENGTGAACVLGSDATCALPSGSSSGGPVTPTDASGTVTTANTYQTVITAGGGSRKACGVQNTSTATELLKDGTTIWTLLPGQSFPCANGLTVDQNAIQITSPTQGASFSANSQ